MATEELSGSIHTVERAEKEDQTYIQALSIPNADATIERVTAATVPASNDIQRVPGETVVGTVDSNDDPLGFGQHKRGNVTTKQLKEDYPKARPRKMKKFYSKQNALIDQFLGSGDEERLAALDLEENGKKIKIAVYGSFLINLALFVIQLYAAISTGSLSLFATATDAFVSTPSCDGLNVS